jgi:hypothetical protein
MPTSDQLLLEYQKWFQIVSSEHKIIEERKWSELNQFDAQKQGLLEKIQKIEAQDPQWKQSESDALRVLIHQVADLEQLNASLIQERTSELQGTILDIGKRSSLVRQIQERYEGPSSGSNRITHQA